MEEEKRNDQARGENGGTPISVRPGNFMPRGQNGQQNADNAPRNGGKNRNRRRRRGGGGNRQENERPAGENRREAADREGENPENGSRENGSRHDRRGGRDRRDNRGKPQEQGRREDDRGHHGGRDRRREDNAPRISSTLREELDSEFAATPFADRLPKKPGLTQETESAADTDEFAVDIATAAYLIEDIPTGFPAPDGKSVEVVGVRFRHAGKVYFFSPEGIKFHMGDSAVVDTARGQELGEVVLLNRHVAEKNISQPLRSVVRLATKEDIAHEAENRKKEAEALTVCAEKIAAHKLDMRLVDAQYTFDNSKLLFYFTAEGRVDFRDLVRDLAGFFRTRIELRQIGIRDESRLIGGLGMCGRPFCCATFLSDFGQVSVKMAKEQGLSINTSKISGCCGRLMCCLRYEQKTYELETALTPGRDARVMTPDGPGTVTESAPIAGTVKVRLDSAEEDEAPAVYPRDDVTLLAPSRPAQVKEPETDDEDDAAKTPADDA